MQRLLKRGLLHGGLVELNTPELISRYNRCLEIAGIEPENLSRIEIDGAGWSPQVAQVKKNPFYLCQALANPLAVVVSPDQFKKPVYFPTYSWMRPLLRSIFDGNFREIADITATSGIVFDFENSLGSFTGPLDLLLLTSVTAVPNTDGLTEVGKEQAELVAKFLDGNQCLNEEVRENLRSHARTHGDLRKRRLEIRPPEFNAFQDFFTVAFGGAAVLRGVSNGADVLILENESTYHGIAGAKVDAETFFLHDPERAAFRFLLNAGLIRVPHEEYVKNPNLLQRKIDTLLAWSILDFEEGVDWMGLTSGQRKGLIRTHQKNLPDIYHELERFAASIQAKKKVPEISFDLILYLASPAVEFHPATQEVLWILLTRVEPRNILDLYTYDKNKFLEMYREFPKGKKEWAAQYLAAHYTPRMLQP